MLIGSYTGATFYDNIRNQKSYAGLLIHANVGTTDTLQAIKLSCMISKKNGTNVILFNKIPIVDLFALSTFGNFTTVKETSNIYVGYVDLAEDGNLALEDGDEIISSIEGAEAADIIKVFGFEEPTTTFIYKAFETKQLIGEFTNVALKSLDEYEAVSISNLSNINDLTIGYDNGKFVKYTKEELQYISRTTDYMTLITQTTATTSLITFEWLDRILLPMVGVTSLEINKNAGQAVNAVFISNKQL